MKTLITEDLPVVDDLYGWCVERELPLVLDFVRYGAFAQSGIHNDRRLMAGGDSRIWALG